MTVHSMSREDPFEASLCWSRPSRAPCPAGLTTWARRNQTTNTHKVTLKAGLSSDDAASLAGHAVPGRQQRVKPLPQDRFTAVAAQSITPVVDPVERRLDLVQLLPGRRDEARGHLKPVAS